MWTGVLAFYNFYQQVTITTRHLLSHQSGIRHYKVKDPNKKEKENNRKKNETDSNKQKSDDDNNEKAKHQGEEATDSQEKMEKGEIQDESAKPQNEEQCENEEKCTGNKEQQMKQKNSSNVTEHKKDEINKIVKSKCKRGKGKKKEEEEEDEFDMKEYYIKEEFNTVQEALELFQNDELFFKPGK